ncbi:MAG: helix-turn-helix transcriptional regulator [Bacteroidales bacterium]|nr:MAG: helix-turn-helix transcriptional regulator [Bacteroidales bacterium]
MSETDIKNLIVESATKFFSKYGFHKTTMDEIAKHIHKAKGVLYYYFKSKEELFNEVLKQELSNVKTELSKIINSGKDYLTIIKNYFLTRLKLLSTAVNYHETLKADFFEKYHFVKDVRDEFAEFEYTQLTLLFRKGNSEGRLDIKNVKSTVNMVMMLLKSIELPLYLQNKYHEYEKTIDELVTMIINSLRSYKK